MDTELSEKARLQEMVRGHMIMQAISVATRLGIPDLLENGPLATEKIADLVGADPARLLRLLRALTSVGIFNQTESDELELTRMGHWLLSNREDGLNALAAMNSDRYLWDSWGNTLDIIKGKPHQGQSVREDNLWCNYQDRENELVIFQQAMKTTTHSLVKDLCKTIELATGSSLADIGGGSGDLLSAILAHREDLIGKMVDLPQIITAAQDRPMELSIRQRIEWIGLDFLKDQLPTADGYILKDVLHNWNDADCISLLKKCRMSIPPKGHLWIVENLYEEQFCWMDIHLMVMFDSEVRDLKKMTYLLGQAGFEACPPIPLSGGYQLIGCKPSFHGSF